MPVVNDLSSRERLREELSLLPTLLSVAETESFARAARAKGLSRNAVRDRVRALEAIVGFPLYRRRGKRIELTAEGQRMLRYAREVESLHHCRHRVYGDGRAVLACTGTILRHVLSPALAAFTARDAGTLEVTTTTEAEAIAAVREERADLAVTTLRVTGIPCVRLLRARPRVATRDGHPLLAAPVRRELLATARVITAKDVKLLHDPVDLVATVDEALALAASGIGVAMIEGFHQALPSLRTATIVDAPYTTLWVSHTRTLQRERGPEGLRRAIFDTVR